MPRRIPQQEIDRIKRVTNLAALARSRGVELEKRGRDYVGRCPFHEDKTPSFVISPDRNLWNCLGACRTGGSVIDFVMKTDNLAFREAVTLLLEWNSRDRDEPEPGGSEIQGDERELLRAAVEHYHARLRENPRALDYLSRRGLLDYASLDRFSVGFCDQTLASLFPSRNTAAGKAARSLLKKTGLLTESGREFFAGRLTFPVLDAEGFPLEIYGRRADAGQGGRFSAHVYLPGPHRGIWNPEALESEEIILCESIIDAISVYASGFANVTAAYGAGGFTAEMQEAFTSGSIRRVYIAYDADAAGDKAAAELARKLMSAGLECLRVNFPKGMDAAEYLRKTGPRREALGLLLRAAENAKNPGQATEKTAAVMMPQESARRTSLLAAGESDGKEEAAKTPEITVPLESPDLPCRRSGAEVEVMVGERHYRIRGLMKNQTPDALKVNLRVAREGVFHIDTLDLYNARARGAFVSATAAELELETDMVKRDLGQVILKLEELRASDQEDAEQEPVHELTPEEKTAALEYLKNPDLLERIARDFEECGLVGERSNALAGYLASLTRKMGSPLAVIIQSSSSSGKSTLMDAILNFAPPEDVVKYSAMTGQSLYYLGEKDLQHKILAIAEEEGAEKAGYALKMLQSEGRLSIASTSKDPETGKMATREYSVEGPVMILMTTTNVEIDEELQNRCLILTVDEDREQTARIQAAQRTSRTYEGVVRRERRELILKLHRNVQRLLEPAPILNSFAERLTFPGDKNRMRRDNLKYLTLIDALTLLHQFSREKRSIAGKEYVQTRPEDVREANRLVGDVMGASLDDLAPQTRRFLERLHEMITRRCEKEDIEQADCLFTRREAREFTGLSHERVRIHLDRLADLEFARVHRSGGRGIGFVYELLYKGEGAGGLKFLTGLVDVDKVLAKRTDQDNERPEPSNAS